MRYLALSILLVCLYGCDESPDGVDPEQACIDAGHELALAGEQCGEWSYAEGQAEWQRMVGGDCSKATSVRDADELYEQCIPWLQDPFCPLIQMGTLDSSCKNQIGVK